MGTKNCKWQIFSRNSRGQSAAVDRQMKCSNLHSSTCGKKEKCGSEMGKDDREGEGEVRPIMTYSISILSEHRYKVHPTFSEDQCTAKTIIYTKLKSKNRNSEIIHRGFSILRNIEIRTSKGIRREPNQA